jgi:hypothetical protein
LQHRKPVLRFRDLLTTLLKQRAPIASAAKCADPAGLDEKDLPKGWLADDIEKGGNNDDPGVDKGDLNEVDASDEEEEEEDLPEPLDAKAIEFDVGMEYGVNLDSPILLDLLSDQPIEGAATEVGGQRNNGVGAVCHSPLRTRLWRTYVALTKLYMRSG